MEFNQRLQELRKQKGLTQEELAERLYVSRTAVSKWESGRGYPNIDSLKDIAKFFSVSIDELLSSGEALTIAEADVKRKENRFRDLVYGLMDVSVVMFFFLPFFAGKGDAVQSVSLWALSGVQSYLKVLYCILTAGMIMVGLLTLALQNCQAGVWLRCKTPLSLVVNGVALALFIVSLQAYAGVFAFAVLAIKGILLIKR